MTGPARGATVGGVRHLLRRGAITLVGGTVVAVGVALLVLPGPGLLLIVAGLAVLATEYAWARALLDRTRGRAEQVAEAAVSSRGSLAFSVALGVAALVLGVVAFTVQPELSLGGFSASPTVLGVSGLVAGVVILTSIAVQMRQAKRLVAEKGRAERGTTPQ